MKTTTTSKQTHNAGIQEVHTRGFVQRPTTRDNCYSDWVL